MELRHFARGVVEGRDLDAKLAPPPEPCTDDDPGTALRLTAPGRPPGLEVAAGTVKVPPRDGFADPAQAPRVLHGLANHELQAAELFAWALLAFPAAPAGFRRGLAAILSDEQRHTRMYRGRLQARGHDLGDFPVSGYFWSKVPTITSPRRFICAMSLTFENANLDHTCDYAAAARAAGDEKTARVLERIHRDEIEHVRFGWRWLERLKDADESMWDAYRTSLTWPLRPAKARAASFRPEGRRRAGMDEEFIRRLEASWQQEPEP